LLSDTHDAVPPYPRPAAPRRAGPLIAGVVIVALLGAGAVVADVVMFTKKPTSASAPGGSKSAATGGQQPTTEPSQGTVTTVPSTDTTLPSTDPTTSVPATASATTEAQAVDSMVQKSQQARSGIAAALTDIANCNTSAADTNALQTAMDARQSLIDDIASQDLTALPGGGSLADELTNLWQLSVNADSSYLSWAGSNTCDGSTDANKAQGDAYSQQATAAKVAFLARWNPIAKQYHLPTRDPGAI